MSTRFDCERTLLVQADFDGELDAAQAAALIEHQAQCPHCGGVRAQLARSRELMRVVPRYSVPPELRESIQQSVSVRIASVTPAAVPPAGRRASRVRSLGWGAAVAATAVLVTVWVFPRSPGVPGQLVANHLRAMQLDSHLIDVASTDHHTVKPWFAGKVNFAPLVKELDAEGYALRGGRVDIVEGSAAAVLVYEAGRHVVDVYMWPARASVSATFRPGTVDGFHLRHWEEGGLTVWCVSDLGEEELDRFVARWRGA
jgi:anti-sigma factor RsiW